MFELDPLCIRAPTANETTAPAVSGRVPIGARIESHRKRAGGISISWRERTVGSVKLSKLSDYDKALGVRECPGARMRSQVLVDIKDAEDANRLRLKAGLEACDRCVS